MFQHSDLPVEYRRIGNYLKDKKEPVAIYALDADIKYEDFMKGHPMLAKEVSDVLVLKDARIRAGEVLTNLKTEAAIRMYKAAGGR